MSGFHNSLQLLAPQDGLKVFTFQVRIVHPFAEDIRWVQSSLFLQVLVQIFHPRRVRFLLGIGSRVGQIILTVFDADQCRFSRNATPTRLTPCRIFHTAACQASSW